MSVEINLNNVQETLVSGTNIKTLNGNSLLGAGDLTISSANRSTANTTVTGNRAHNFASFREQWDNIQQFKLTANIAPPLGEASFRFQGHGTGDTDMIANIVNGNGLNCFRVNGTRQALFSNGSLANPSIAFDSVPTRGWYHDQAGQITIFADNNLKVIQLSASGVNIGDTGEHARIPIAAIGASNVAYGFRSAPNTGLNRLFMWAGGVISFHYHANGISVNSTSNLGSALGVDGVNGYNQFRMVKSYTPTSTADTNGQAGDTAWDANFWYIKTAAGWKRSALTTF